ncbi:DUF6299 family protein [Streptomyces sp. SP17BM10]|uniref:DUF6299 family protein n=1 Tax=Streptomyces sp. SP17BM10 TaxID=3002530 RepID=UPI002E785FBE|nr:DUF6299 family protein [Streptomyces sp. SP17BM10]MEE1788790.1 DUF6299 family protein [Streptomyces sp. SP17BM10]
MRKLRTLAAVATAMIGLATPGAAATAATAPAVPSDAVSVTGGTLADDGTVTLTGGYRCTERPGKVVLIGSNVIQDGHPESIGGFKAQCDGTDRTWTNTGRPMTDGRRPSPLLRTGPATVKATMLTMGPNGMPLPQPIATAESPVELLAG